MKHKGRELSEKEITENRSSAYEFQDFDELHINLIPNKSFNTKAIIKKVSKPKPKIYK